MDEKLWTAIGISVVCIVILFAEGCLIIPEKMPWNRRNEKHGKR